MHFTASRHRSTVARSTHGQSGEIFHPPMVQGWHWKFTSAMSGLSLRSMRSSCTSSSGTPSGPTMSGSPARGFMWQEPSFMR